jgi:type VI secretion system protein ImpG
VREDFLGYYNRELSYLRQLGAEFGSKHPTIASGLKLGPDTCDDPHVERLLDAFAFLAARIHLRIDDEFPEITSALLEELYPHFTRPVPSLAMVEFQLDPELGRSTTERKIPRGTGIQSRPSEGFVCKFRTCYDTALWPLTVESATWRPGSSLPAGMAARQTAAAIELRIACLPDVSFASLDLSRLRFYLNGGFDVVGPLYELLLDKCHTILIQDPAPGTLAKPFRLEPGALVPVGFAEDEGLSWYPRRSFAGYQVIEDYFVFPEKYLFLDLHGLEGLKKNGFARQASIFFLISPFERAERRSVLEQGVSAGTFRLGCTPIVNLFPVASDPIPVRGNVYEAPVPTDPRMEIYSVDGVFGQVSFTAERRSFRPFISCREEEVSGAVPGYWKAVRRPSRRDENSSEVFLSLSDRGGQPVDPQVDSLTVKLTCTNRDRPFRLPMGDPKGDFQMEEHPEIQRILCLHRPTPGSSAPSAKTSLWRLVSQLALNHLSLVDEGKEALECLLRVHSFGESESAEENIKGIVALASRPHFARVSSQHGMAFVRGKRVEITVDESCFVGSSIFLFGNVLDRFLGLYTSLNSFSQLALRSRQRGDKPMHIWPARAGAKVVL